MIQQRLTLTGTQLNRIYWFIPMNHFNYCLQLWFVTELILTDLRWKFGAEHIYIGGMALSWFFTACCPRSDCFWALYGRSHTLLHNFSTHAVHVSCMLCKWLPALMSKWISVNAKCQLGTTANVRNGNYKDGRWEFCRSSLNNKGVPAVNICNEPGWKNVTAWWASVGTGVSWPKCSRCRCEHLA